MDLLTDFIGRHGYLPHGYCISWSPLLLWTMVASDALIAAAYFSIPWAILSFFRRRSAQGTTNSEPLRWIGGLFCAFIFACGVTHLMDIWTIWAPDYGLQATTKVITAAVSVVTAALLWPLIPKVLRLPSAGQLQQAVTDLEAEVGLRRSAEEHATAIEQRLSLTLASIEAGFITTDRAGRITGMNAVAERITGWPAREGLGRLAWEVFDRQDRPQRYLAMSPVDVMIEQGVTEAMAQFVTAISRDGRRTPVEVRAALSHAEDGSVRGLGMVLRDMTETNRAELERGRMAAIVESSNDAIIGKTLDGRITSWNRAAEVMFGYSADEAIGMPVQRLIPNERAAEEMRILTDMAQGRQVTAFDTVRQAKDGRYIEVSITISPIRDASGRIVGASKIARDATPQRRAEQARLRTLQLEAENRRIQDASRMKSQFLANMSHELRTPLNAVIGFADLLQTGAVPAGSAKEQQFLGHIGDSGRHLLQLINDLLDLSKVESGQFVFHPEPVDLPRLVHDVVNVLQTSMQRQGLRVELELEAGLDDLEVDPARLKQVLYNYLSNAIKFSHPGGLVIVRARAEGPDCFRIEVEDQGIGIAEADLARLFVEFQQLDAGYSKQHQGTGLGLALTRRLVAAQGGTVGVRSVPGQGSVFHAVLKRRPEPDRARSSGGPADTGFAESPDRRVLLLEGHSHAHASLGGTFEQAGYQVDKAGNAAQARQQVRERDFAAISLDLSQRNHDGLQTLDGLRRTGAQARLPVISLALSNPQGDAGGFMIADLLRKPLHSSEVLGALAGVQLAGRPVQRVLVIDDDLQALTLMGELLDGAGLTALVHADGRTALSEIDLIRPDAIILDLMMPGYDGFEALHDLARLPAWRHLPVFIWTSMILTEAEYQLLARSAVAILDKGGGDLDHLLERLRAWRPSTSVATATATGQGSGSA